MYTNEKNRHPYDKNGQVSHKSLQIYYTLKKKLENEIEKHLLTDSAQAKLQYLQACIENQDPKIISQKKIALQNQLTDDQAKTYYNFSSQKKLDKYIFIANKILIHHQNFNYLTEDFQIQMEQSNKWIDCQIQLNRLKGTINIEQQNLHISLENSTLKPVIDPQNDQNAVYLILTYQNKNHPKISKSAANLEIPDNLCQFSSSQQKKQLIRQQLLNRPFQFTQNKEIPGNYQQLIQKLQSESEHKLVFQNNQIRILQNKKNQENFKLKMTHHSPSYNLLLVLNQFELYQNWNMDIVQTEIIKSLANQYLIIYQRTKSKSMFYKDREYIFQRQFKQFDDIYLMLDQSIDFDLEDTLFRKQGQYFLQKGTIEFANWGFFTNQGGTQFNNLMILDIKMNNNGFLSSGQNQHMILDYLKSFGGLDLFASQYLQSQDKKQLLRTFNIYPVDQNNSNNNSSNNSSNLENQTIQTQAQPLQSSLKEKQNDIQFHLNNIKPEQLTQIQENQKQVDQNDQSTNQQNQSTQNIQNKEKNSNNSQKKEQNYKQIEQNDKYNEQSKQIQNEKNQKNDKQNEQNKQSQIQALQIPQQLQEDPKIQPALELLQINDFIDQEFIPLFHETPSSELKRAVERKMQLLRENKHYLISCLKHNYEMKTSQIKEPKKKIKYHYGLDVLRGDFKRDSKKGVLEFNNKEKEKYIGKASTFVIKKIGKNIFSAKSLINISLPIFVFDFSSNLYRQALGLGYTPTHLDKAAATENPVEQMKWVMTNQLSSIVLQLNISKPFNPILGETFQGFVNNNPVYYEQISHHPPIFAFQYFGKNFIFQGNGQTIVNMHANSVNAANIGFFEVKFLQTQNTIYTTCPETIFTGTVMGNRMINLDGKIYGWDLQNNLYCEIQINPKKKSMFHSPAQKCTEDYFAGGIFEITPQYKEKIILAMSKRIASTGQKLQLEQLKEKDIIKQLSSCSGIWHEQILWEEQEFWNIKKTKPFPVQHDEFALPSDCNYRLDTLSWKCRDQEASQVVKEELENAQRYDKKLRQKFEKQNKYKK
ncbi:hypothetical protein PPERSA_02221 [Pseudocohnilembus persalinus]|uniref:Oxysterol-binding protein n=1 Tax=Pseudocohnilembus persalinus TaxID=266149 RepID=A0A0V0QKI4_PSEPJ|nr:hypothetical protein PPERSA_02221 [Pseudocohnilembus persalinus]|eukprot:KRX02731.1 hypothetical protein PPERSA_02221 [Pseudocohnilembus persalinus]